MGVEANTFIGGMLMGAIAILVGAVFGVMVHEDGRKSR